MCSGNSSQTRPGWPVRGNEGSGMLADEVSRHMGYVTESPEGQVRTVAVTPGEVQNHNGS